MPPHGSFGELLKRAPNMSCWAEGLAIPRVSLYDADLQLRRVTPSERASWPGIAGQLPRNRHQRFIELIIEEVRRIIAVVKFAQHSGELG